MSTIGYGNLPPQSTYLNTVVFIEAWVALIVDALLVSLTVGKISRPTYAALSHDLSSEFFIFTLCNLLFGSSFSHCLVACVTQFSSVNVPLLATCLQSTNHQKA
jgi:hypothetical protein